MRHYYTLAVDLAPDFATAGARFSLSTDLASVARDAAQKYHDDMMSMYQILIGGCLVESPQETQHPAAARDQAPPSPQAPAWPDHGGDRTWR